jgi:hypothetical protein
MTDSRLSLFWCLWLAVGLAQPQPGRASVTFKNLSYTDPSPLTNTPGSYCQAPTSVVFSESFASKPSTGGVVGTYWNGVTGAPLTYPAPPTLQAGVKALSIEFWMKIPSNASIGTGAILSAPGLVVAGSWQWAATLAGVIQFRFAAVNQGWFVQNNYQTIGAIHDNQWHQYVGTFDGHTSVTYIDGEKYYTVWTGNDIAQIGPLISETEPAPTQISLGGGQNPLDEVRLSTVVLSPAEVRRNFDNYRQYLATYYASPTGSVTQSGTSASPMTLATALTRIGPDIRIILTPGTYDGTAFTVSRSGTSPLHSALVTGDNGTGQVVLSTTGAGAGPRVSGARHLTLRNLTFRTDQQAALTVSNATAGLTLDACRFTGNQHGLLVTDSSGLVDPAPSWSPTTAQKYCYHPGVTLQNSVISVPGISVSFTNSAVSVLRNNTIAGGTVGARYDGTSHSLTLLNNLFTGQSNACVSFSTGSESAFAGDGNLYHPAGTGVVAAFATATGTTCFVEINDYVRNWQTYFYPSSSSFNRQIGLRNEQSSVTLIPAFVDAANGDFRLAAVPGNVIDAGVPTIFLRWSAGIYPTGWDAQGAPRTQGNGVDIGAYETVGPLEHTFTLTAAARTSSGVFKPDGSLIRTLWSGIGHPDGPVTIWWNGLDDRHQPVPAGAYTLKILANNVEYVWDGAAGNNSQPLSGPNPHACFLPIQSMSIMGSNAFYTAGYNEGRHQIYRFNPADPRHTTANFAKWELDRYVEYLDTDLTRLYALSFASGNSSNHSDILTVYNQADLSVVSGTPLLIDSGPGASDLAVQRFGSLLFLAHQTDNRIYLFNKTTFLPAARPFISVNSPRAIATMPSGDLWVLCLDSSNRTQVVRYTNCSTSPTLATTLTGLSSPLGLDVIQLYATLLVADGGASQQVKAFSSAGQLLWTLGQPGGYSNGPAITRDKFVINGLVAGQNDGSFWVGDTATGFRALHFNASRQYLAELQYVPHSYCEAVDPNNSTRVFNLLTEYRIDYAKPYTGGEGWTPVNYWGYYQGNDLPSADPRRAHNGLVGVATLSNNRTYGLVADRAFSPIEGTQGVYRVVELTATGLRVTGYNTPQYKSYWLDKDGSFLWEEVVGNSTARFYRVAMTGFDGAGNPQWSTASTVVATAPWSKTWDDVDPAVSGPPIYAPGWISTDSGRVVCFNPAASLAGRRLGMVDPAANRWLWKAAPAIGTLNGRGNFDPNANYAGSRVMSAGPNIVFGYYGEGWNGGQANQFMHYSDDGLFIGQFGQPGIVGVTSANTPGFAGNNFSPSLVQCDSGVYLYCNDESDRGSHRWHLSGLETVAGQSSSFTVRADGTMTTCTTNGTPLDWLLGHFGPAANDNYDLMDGTDTDRDGLTAGQEFVAGTDPTNRASVFRFNSARAMRTNEVVIRWPSSSNRVYALRRSTTLDQGTNGFTTVAGAGAIRGTPPENVFTDSVLPVGSCFYRINVSQ